MATASLSNCSWYAADRQPLLTTNSTPSDRASRAATRNAERVDADPAVGHLATGRSGRPGRNDDRGLPGPGAGARIWRP